MPNDVNKVISVIPKIAREQFPKTPRERLPFEDSEQFIEKAFNIVLMALGMDLKNDSLKNTPKRVAKMYVNETFKGLFAKNYPKMTVQENSFNYRSPLIVSNIEVVSTCEHHFQPIIGKAHVAYIPKDKVLGLSKFNRLVDYYSRRPQVQERLTNQIGWDLIRWLDTFDVAVVIDAKHFCVKARGVEHAESVTRTSFLMGNFSGKDESFREEFFNSIPKVTEVRL